MAELTLIDTIKPEEIATICDHTFLDTVEGYKYKDPRCDPIIMRRKDFIKFLDKSVYGSYSFAAICVRGSDTAYARKFIDDAHRGPLTLAVTAGFPDGRCSTNQKKYETIAAIEDGADEIDFVMNWHWLMREQDHLVRDEIKTLARTIRNKGKKSKIILETAFLDEGRIIKACKYAEEAGIDYVKTSTGYTCGATPQAVSLMRRVFSGGVKASGGVKQDNVKDILRALSGRKDGFIELDPQRMRIGEGSLFKEICGY